MKLIRYLLGRLILAFDFIFQPRGKKRAADEQAKVDAITQDFTLYQYAACPFCVKVRREMKRESVKLATVDAKTMPYQDELKTQGGQLKVPCLKITRDGNTQWLYESDDIITYIKDQIQTA